MRYFVFYYIYTDEYNRQGCGFIPLVKPKGFPSSKEIRKEVRHCAVASEVVLTGFNEFKSEQDYLDFTGKAVKELGE